MKRVDIFGAHDLDRQWVRPMHDIRRGFHADRGKFSSPAEVPRSPVKEIVGVEKPIKSREMSRQRPRINTV